MLIGHGARDSDGHSGTERSRTPSRASTSDRPAGYKAVQEDAARIGGHNTVLSRAASASARRLPQRNEDGQRALHAQ